MRREARAALAARWSEWKTADKRIGYTRAKKAEEEIADVEEALAKEMWSAAPRSVAGVAVKLHSLLERRIQALPSRKRRGRRFA
jgi:hypothetical protein